MEMEMRVGLIDVDSKWKTHGNLALMKIASYHKGQGDPVEWAHPLYMKQFDKIYASSLFTTSNKDDIPYFAVKGGPGFIADNCVTITLPPEIERCNPDYSLYHLDFSYQRYSKGCENGCRFCVVPELEGHVTTPVRPMALNPKGKYIYLLDSNFFASERWRWAIEHLRKVNQPIHWEGIDVRILSPEMVDEIFSMPLKGRIHIAWDNPREKIDKRIAYLFNTESLRRKVMCYVLIGFNSKKEEDLYRVETLRSLGVDPFVMPYDRSDMYQRNFARWCNHKPIWKTIPWAKYNWKMNKTGVHR